MQAITEKWVTLEDEEDEEVMRALFQEEEGEDTDVDSDGEGEAEIFELF